MSQTLTVPAVIVVQLRQALLSDLGSAGSEIHSGSEIADADLHPEGFTAPIEHFDRYRALLDVIGWVRLADSEQAEIDLDTHGWALFTTLESLLEIERDLADVPPHLAGRGDQKPTAEKHVREIEYFLSRLKGRTMRAERPIVLLVLDDDRPALWARAEIEAGLDNIPPLEIGAALAHLATESVVILDGEQIQASRCARHLDRLGMIAV